MEYPLAMYSLDHIQIDYEHAVASFILPMCKCVQKSHSKSLYFVSFPYLGSMIKPNAGRCAQILLHS